LKGLSSAPYSLKMTLTGFRPSLDMILRAFFSPRLCLALLIRSSGSPAADAMCTDCKMKGVQLYMVRKNYLLPTEPPGNCPAPLSASSNSGMDSSESDSVPEPEAAASRLLLIVAGWSSSVNSGIILKKIHVKNLSIMQKICCVHPFSFCNQNLNLNNRNNNADVRI
jgi:hypothetical protein